MKTIIILIILLFNSINAIPILDCQYQKQGYTLPPTTIYYLHNREQFGKITRNDIKNNSNAIGLFGSTNVIPGKLKTVANNETILFALDNSDPFFGPEMYYIQRNIDSISIFSGTEGWGFNFYGDDKDRSPLYIHGASITFDDCSKDYYNITAWGFNDGYIHLILSSSFGEDEPEEINTTAKYRGHFKSFYDKISMVYYLSSIDNENKLSNLIIFDVINRSSSKYSIEHKEKTSAITAYKKSFYIGEKKNNKYLIYKYDLSIPISSNNKSNNENEIKTNQLILELDYEISNIIPCENPSYFILYSDKSNVLIVYNIDNSSYEKFTNFKIPLHHHKKYSQSFIARGGPPIEPNQIKKKKNFVAPILISIIGFSVIVFSIIITVLLIKRRNSKKLNEKIILKDSESEIQNNKD
ncbi:hypothetical protein ACTA71_006803 [Dictyostelium dimigraforme]